MGGIYLKRIPTDCHKQQDKTRVIHPELSVTYGLMQSRHLHISETDASTIASRWPQQRRLPAENQTSLTMHAFGSPCFAYVQVKKRGRHIRWIWHKQSCIGVEGRRYSIFWAGNLLVWFKRNSLKLLRFWAEEFTYFTSKANALKLC